MKISTWALPLLGLAVFACNPPAPDNSSSTTGSTSETKPKLKVGIVYDTGGLGDKSFNDSANRGIERAKEELGIEAITVQSKATSDYETNMSTLASDGCQLVIAVGLGMGDFMKKVAPQFPDVNFAIVDGDLDGKNVRCLKFNEEEGSFLAGYLAGALSKTGKLGFVGGMEIDLIRKFQYGYWAGAKMANPNIQLLGAKYTMSWDSTDKGKASAAALFSEGADVVYHAAGRAGLGVIKAAEEANKLAIGVDSDQDDISEGHVLTSMIKHVDEAVYQTIKDAQEGKFSAGVKVYDLASNGVSLSEMRFTKDLVSAELQAKLDKVKQGIIDGTIKVPSTEADFKAFTPPSL